MLLKREIIKHVTILLVLLLIFQLILGAYENIERLDNHAEKSTVVLSKNVANTDVTLLISDSRRITFYSASTEYYYRLIGHMQLVDISENKVLYHAVPMDYRKEIKQAVPHNFHGSKYKDSSLII